MIYTLTLSPALDYLVWLDHFEAGELNRTERTAYRPGGKGINVAVVLSRLGCQTIALGYTAGFVGVELTRLLDVEGVQHEFIHLNEGCTRINVKIKAGMESEINAYGPRISQNDLEKLTKQVGQLGSDDTLILSGNPPKNMSADIYSILMGIANEQGVRMVLDTSGSNLLSALDQRPWLIKPNKAELEEICETRLNSLVQLAEAAQNLQKKGAANVLVSLGADGALLAADDGKVYACEVPAGKLIDSTGAGDSMVAGFVARDLAGASRDDCLRYAVSCGCACAYSYELPVADEVEKLYNQTPSAHIFKE